MAAARPIRWDIYEEHLDEAAFLWGMWEDALTGASYALHDVIVGPEERLLAHLDGLVLGGAPVASQVLFPALADDDPGKVFGAAWALLQAEHGDELEGLLEAAAGVTDPKPVAALARAFELSLRGDLPRRLSARFDASTPALQSVIATALACRHGERGAPAGGLALPPLLSASDPALRIAGLRALRRARDPQLTRTFAPHIEEAMGAEHTLLRETAIEAGIVLGLRASWDACRQRANQAPGASRLTLSLLALGGEPAALFNLDNPALRRDALWALGFVGTLEAAEAALALTEDDELAPLAGDAFTLITGLVLAAGMVKTGETDNALADPEEDEAPPPELKPEDRLPVPDPKRLRAFWETARSRFEPGVRHVFGQRASAHSLQVALANSAMWRRRLFGVEVAVRSSIDIDARQWARAQEMGTGSLGDLRLERPLPGLATI